MRLRGSTGAIAMAVAVTAVLSGCSGTGEVALQECLPARLHVTPRTVAPGAAITVSSGPATCDLGYEDGHRYRLHIALARHVSSETAVPVGRDGRFTATMTVPVDFPAGAATVIVGEVRTTTATTQAL